MKKFLGIAGSWMVVGFGLFMFREAIGKFLVWALFIGAVLTVLGLVALREEQTERDAVLRRRTLANAREPQRLAAEETFWAEREREYKQENERKIAEWNARKELEAKQREDQAAFQLEAKNAALLWPEAVQKKQPKPKA